MKLLELKMSAFGPFCEEISLSFVELGRDGLFLLHGNTGSGKTTIFDAICFALFGNASGESRGADSFRSDYADESRKTFAELSFSHQGEEYRVYRAPAYERKKKRGDGVTLSKAEAELYKAGQLVTSGYVPVTNEIVALLGIDWKQFKQIAMLAQGEFLKLLYADSVERAGILRRIFGTEHYEALQRNLKASMLEKKATCEELEKSLQQLLAGIQTEPEEPFSLQVQDWKQEKSVHGIPKVLEVLQQLIHVQKQLQKKMSSQKEEQQKKLQELTVKEAFSFAATKKREACTKYRKEKVALQKAQEELAYSWQAGKEQTTLLEEEGRNWKEQLPALEQVEEQLRELTEEQKKRQEEWKRFTGWKQRAEELERLRRKKVEKQKIFLTLYQTYEAAREEAVQAERLFLAEQAGILAEQLTDGMPCPVCGSTTHPHKAVISADTVSEAVVKEKKAVMEQAGQASTEANTECYGLKKEYWIRTETYLEELKQAGLQHELVALETEEECTVLRQCFKQYGEELKKELDVLQEKLRESKQKVDVKWQLVQKIETNQKQKEQLQEELMHIEKQKLAKQEQLAGIERLLQEAEQELSEQGMESLQEVEVLRTGKALLEQEQKEAEMRLQQLFSRVSTNERIIQEAERLYEKYTVIKKEYLLVVSLSKTANGELAGKARIPFEQYAQAFYFEQILQAANRKLYTMTNGQYELRRKKEASNLRSISGLELEVMDYYTGKIRGIRSLSGGESFQAALALALGLSDVIEAFAGGIELGVLFLDEGFGTLDSQALDTAVTTLRLLAGGQRTVGIISHVEELKERIEKKVMVVKDKTGSRIQVQG